VLAKEGVQVPMSDLFGVAGTRADRSSARFVVERTAQYDKQRSPTDDVHYPTLTAALRLVTCGGQFDYSAGHYRSNIIFFAALRT
jgi:hypothetical protein